jgi:membrane carboxypeptidase/penicillin-binding protein
MRTAALIFAFLLAAYAAYLGIRVAEERDHAPVAVAALLKDPDPALDEINGRHIAILLRVEDPTFWTNDGIDLSSPGAGLTTLAQGLGKRIFFRDFAPGLAKPELMVLTRFALVPRVTKRDILRAFVATAYLGDDSRGPINGFPEGARRWFGRELGELSERQYIGLVAMLVAPNALDPIRNSAAHEQRVQRIERLIAGQCEPSGLRDVMLDGCAPA